MVSFSLILLISKSKAEQSRATDKKQRFMQADPYWATAGAINVMLVFLFRYNAEGLRRLNPIYWVVCYGVPAIPAIFGLIYRKNGKQMYGDATVSPPRPRNILVSIRTVC
jgi:cell division protein FtsW (lipid II flippase)